MASTPRSCAAAAASARGTTTAAWTDCSAQPTMSIIATCRQSYIGKVCSSNSNVVMMKNRRTATNRTVKKRNRTTLLTNQLLTVIILSCLCGIVCTDDVNDDSDEATTQTAVTSRLLYNNNNNEIFSSWRESSHPPKVRVTVYFESLCSDSVDFFRDQLTPTYRRLQNIIDLEFVPFGKALARPYLTEEGVRIHFECQHGPRECVGNRVMSCAQSLLSVTAQHDLFSCMMADFDASTAGKRCAERTGINWDAIESCSRRQLGAVLLYMNGRKTADLRPHLAFVPTVTINGVYDRRSLRMSNTDLMAQVCQTYNAPHHNCRRS